jgi:hypothetical protein
MSTLLYLVTLTGILAISMAVVIGVVAAFLYLRYRLTIEAARQVDFLIEANTARPRPGMARPDPQLRVVGGRDRGPYAG